MTEFTNFKKGTQYIFTCIFLRLYGIIKVFVNRQNDYDRFAFLKYTMSHLKRNLSEMIARWDSRFVHDRFISSFYQGFRRRILRLLLHTSISQRRRRQAYRIVECFSIGPSCRTEKKTKKDGIYIYTFRYIIHMRDMYLSLTEQTATLAPSIADGSTIDVYLPTRSYRTHQLDFFLPSFLFQQDPSTIAIYFP